MGAPDGVDGAFEDADEGEGVAGVEGREMDLGAAGSSCGLLGIEVDDAGEDVALDELRLRRAASRRAAVARRSMSRRDPPAAS